MGVIVDHIGDAAMYEQMAEECVELAKELLKMARIKRGENPTPYTEGEAERRIVEEFSDLTLCVRELELDPDQKIIYQKIDRFKDRWAEAHKEEEAAAVWSRRAIDCLEDDLK